MARGERISTRHFGMLGHMLKLAIAKRIGLAKPALRSVMDKMFSEESKRAAFAGYRPDEHDVFVATFSKSGTNWMMQIAQQIAWHGAAEFKHILEIVPWPDAPAPMKVPLSDTSAREAAPTGLRVIKTHLEPEFVPYDERAIYLTVIRDPKEVVVSGYYFLGGILGILSHITIDDWFERFMAPGGMAETWAAHTAGYWAWRDRPNVLLLSYPEIKRDPEGCIERVAATMGVALSPAERALVIERASLAYMKAHESQFAPPQSPFSDKRNPTRMIRQGRAGASDELLSPAQQAEIDRRCQGELARLGSDFPYAETFEVAPDRADAATPSDTSDTSDAAAKSRAQAAGAR